MSAPQHPTEPAGLTSEATSGAVLSPVPADAGVPAQPDLPDPDDDGADAAVEPADVVGDDDEGADGQRDGDRRVHRQAPMGAVSRTGVSAR